MPNARPSTEAGQVHDELRLENDALKKENLKLQKQIAALKAQVLSAQNGTIANAEGKPLADLTSEQLKYLIHKAKEREEILQREIDGSKPL